MFLSKNTDITVLKITTLEISKNYQSKILKIYSVLKIDLGVMLSKLLFKNEKSLLSVGLRPCKAYNIWVGTSRGTCLSLAYNKNNNFEYTA